MSSRRNERGSSLIITVLVILVLTIVGVGIAYFTQVEEKISGNDQVQKIGFYAAESGLRAGEKLISDTLATTAITFSDLLTSGGAAYAPPGGGKAAVALRINSVSYVNVAALTGVSSKGTYSLYVRNNSEDPSLTVDTDNAITLISVGKAPPPSGIEKVLEERINIANPTVINAGNQVGGGPGGSGAVTN